MSAAIDVSAARALAAQARAAAASPGPPVTRVSVAVPAADPIRWLRERPVGERFYWRGRGSPSVVAAAGCAASIDMTDVTQAADEMRGPLSGLPRRTSFFVTIRFDPSRPVAPEWHDFGRVRFLLPRFELSRGRDGVRLACIVTDGDRGDPEALEKALTSLLEPPAGDSLPDDVALRAASVGRAREDTPVRAEWDGRVSEVLEGMHAGILQKVVLARRSTWELPERLDPIAALQRVVSRAPRSYHVLVETGPSAFLSASPERLLRLDGRRVSTEALAGTRALGGNSAFSSKDHLEHDIVVQDVRERLRPLVIGVDSDAEATEFMLPRRTHLRTRIAGSRLVGTTGLDVMAALHPTPAVGGTPRSEAIDFINRVEPFDRGLYAGVVGRVGRDASGAECAELAVGIRSALIRGRDVWLYAGAGIVAGSDPHEEWNEVEGKMSDLATALGLP